MFGAPEPLTQEEQARRAIDTARTMYFYLEKLNERWQAKAIANLLPTLKMRCGIHQGKAVVGMFGGKQRKDYTAVGTVVNIAARLQTAAAPDRILISESVASCLPNTNWGQSKNFQLKGIEGYFKAFTVAMS